MDKEYAEYLSEKTRQDYNLIAEKFSKYREKPWPQAKFLVDNYLEKGEQVLDIGCGPGQWSEFFKEKQARYVGVDFSEKLIEMARKKHPYYEFKTGHVFNLPFPDNSFDKVYAIALLHALPSHNFRKKALQEIKRVLKDRGRLVLTCWNLWQKKKTRKLIYKFIFLKISGKSKLDFKDILINWQGMEKCYFHCFTQGELNKLIKSLDFKIIKQGKFSIGREERGLPNSNLYIIAEK